VCGVNKLPAEFGTGSEMKDKTMQDVLNQHPAKDPEDNQKEILSP
jgi:hypothetical protein